MRYENLPDYITNSVFFVAGCIFIACLLGIAKILNAIREISSFIEVLCKPKKEKITFKPEELDRESNPRFGFSFLHPKTWDRSDPQNCDGNTFSHPKNPNVKILAWGEFNVLGKDLETIIQDLLSSYERDLQGFSLLKCIQSGKHIIDWIPAEQNPIEVKSQIEAWRIQYEYKEKKTKITVMELHTLVDRTHIGLMCKATTKLYPSYEDFFLFVASEFHILGENAAPFARSKKSRFI